MKTVIVAFSIERITRKMNGQFKGPFGLCKCQLLSFSLFAQSSVC